MKAMLNGLLLCGLLALTACGKDSGGGAAAAPATAIVTANGCTADQIPTQAGCGVYAQQCGYGQALVGTTCHVAIAPTNCGVVTPGQVAPYGCNGQGYNTGYNNGYYNGGGYYSGYNTGGYYYNAQTQTFNTSTYYSQPMYYGNQYGYGYRPYYPKRNGVYVSGQVTFGF